MLILKNVTVKQNGQLILHNCNCEISSQSIIVARNDINTDILAKTLTGFHALDEGEIHLKENILSKNENSTKNVFFIVTENYDRFWKNYRVADIPRIMKIRGQSSYLCEKYDIPEQASFDKLTKFQRLIYIISIGQALDRVIFVFDQPTKYFDYEELRKFNEFINDDFLNVNYVIITNRYDEITTRGTKAFYHIDSNTIKVLKGGEKSLVN